MAKLFTTILFLLAALLFLSGCGGTGGLIPVTDTMVNEAGDIVEKVGGYTRDASLAKSKDFTEMYKTRDQAYVKMYAQSGTTIDFEMVEVKPGVYVQVMKKIVSREAPRFQQNLPEKESEHPVWGVVEKVAVKTLDVAGTGWLATIMSDTVKAGFESAQTKYYGNYNPQTAEPYIVKPEVVLVP